MQNVNSLIAAALAPFAPVATDPTMQALVDEYGALDSHIKALQGKLEMLKSAIKAQGAGKHEGLSYRATVYESAGRTVTDWKAVAEHNAFLEDKVHKVYLMADKAWHLIQNEKMKSVNKQTLMKDLQEKSNIQGFNLYQYIQQYI